MTWLCCREVAALGRSLAAVGGRLDSLLVAASSQSRSNQAVTSATVLSGTTYFPAAAVTVAALCTV